MNNYNGTLTAQKTIFKGIDFVISALFTNSYTTTKATVLYTIMVKVIDNGDSTLNTAVWVQKDNWF